nr:MAG TPA: hypothetical protein [Caudoviricetes sp.]
MEIKYNNLIKVICDICNSYENVLYHDNMENIFCQ